MTEAETQRLDKWLWCARFFKSRGLASKLLAGGKLRLSGKIVTKAHQLVRAGDVLTFPQGREIRVVKVLFLAERRGPAPEAQALFEDLSPPGTAPVVRESALEAKTVSARDAGEGRPTKRDRRRIDRLMGRE